MFRKLLKHEFLATRGLLGTLTCAALFLGIIGGLALRLLIHLALNEPSNAAMASFGGIGLVFAMIFIVFALGAYTLGVQIYLYWRFYKHKFTDEGYLTFTLPVTCTQIYLSSYVSILLWTLISGLVVTLSMNLIALIGAGEYLLDPEVISEINTVFEITLSAYSDISSPALWIISMLVSVLAAPAIPMVCITLGAVLAKKHKILMAFVMYYAISAVLSFFQSMLSVILGLILVPEPEVFLNLSILLPIILSIAVAVGGSVLSIWLTRHKLNLP
jgi:hypothetical protein